MIRRVLLIALVGETTWVALAGGYLLGMMIR